MEGLTISTAESLVQTGKTQSEIRADRMKKDAGMDAQGPSFSDTLEQAVGKVNDLQKSADVMVEKLSTGEQKNIPEVMIAVEKADIALKLMTQVRNKIIDAYQEVMKMQV
ncbi:MAG: flagellar hook-basal body complex protein FliE [Bdellovibrionaceae bacterium]|nr:flagellar hook-basal body complex protein FliE [Pseudobdellovibrionaceae bacterium]|tara:strand:- start:24338 stop:24667 length:330 start_codon:yes stop_codon:yes gene_type:complete